MPYRREKSLFSTIRADGLSAVRTTLALNAPSKVAYISSPSSTSSPTAVSLSHNITIPCALNEAGTFQGEFMGHPYTLLGVNGGMTPQRGHVQNVTGSLSALESGGSPCVFADKIQGGSMDRQGNEGVVRLSVS